MADPGSARIFVSYSRKDGARFAGELRAKLQADNLSVWQDIVALEGGRDWWSQVEGTIKSRTLQHFILVVTPRALDSPVVRREIRLARQEGKTVCPIKGPNIGDAGNLPRWLGQIYDLDIPEHWTTLIRVLEGPSQQKRVAMMAPEPPPDFVTRPAEFGALKNQLLDRNCDAVAITAALRGAGGYGKTTLARALAHDEDIQDAYFDGILWLELGDKPINLLGVMADQIEVLTGERPGLETISAASGKLAEALGDRRILLVIDDAWREQELHPLLQGGRNTTRLVTTRLDDVVPEAAFRQGVDAMMASEALSLLTGGLPEDQCSPLGDELARLAARLGEWALLLKIVNGVLRQRVLGANEPLRRALDQVNRRLDIRGYTVFDAANVDDRHKSVATTIGVSLELLDGDQLSRFVELGIFPEDEELSIEIITSLWEDTSEGRMDALDTEDFLIKLKSLSLLDALDLDRRTIRIHDTIRHFLRDQIDETALDDLRMRALTSAQGDLGVSDLVARVDEIHTLVANDDIQRALKRLVDFASDFSTDIEYRREAIIISRIHRQLQNVQRRGSMSYHDIQRRVSGILYRALVLLDEIRNSIERD